MGVVRGLLFGWFLVAGCTSSAPPLACTPGESRACTCSSGAIGAQVCNAAGTGLGGCVCSPVDAGELGDVGVTDAGVDAHELADAPVVLDAGGPDAGADSGPTWACDVIAQTGCASNYRCRLSEAGRNPENGPPACVRREAGDTVAEDRTCERRFVDGASTDNCGDGLFCWNLTCYRYCLPGGPACPPTAGGDPQHCVTSTYPGSLLDPNPAGLGACTPI